MTPSPRAAQDLPESPYARELERGTRDMNFSPELEREFHRFYLSERHSHVRSFNLIMFLLAAAACVLVSLSPAPMRGTATSWRLGGVALAFGVMAWVARSRYYERIYLRVAHVASLWIAAVAAVEVANRVAVGEKDMLALLTTYSIALYFLAGILTRAALQANAILVVAFAASLVALRQPIATDIRSVAILAGVAAIGGRGILNQRVRFRRVFLEHGLVTELAARDGLTGLANRRGFDAHLARIWQQALRDRKSIAIMMIDIDHFKLFNDRHGHQAGDAALRRIAAAVNAVPRRALDLAARYGGEELAVFLYGVVREGAAKLANDLREAVQALCITDADDKVLNVITVSIGVAIVHPSLTRSPEGAVQLADEALYAAKDGGRNRVEVYETEYASLTTGSFRAR